MSRCSILLKPNSMKVLTITILNCRKNLELEHGFIFVGCQITFNKERSNYSIVNSTCPYIDFLRILCMRFINSVWIFIAPISVIMSINMTRKNVASFEKTIFNKNASSSLIFCIICSQNSIRSKLFSDNLHQVNLEKMEFIFYKNSVDRRFTNVMLLSDFPYE